MPTFGKYNYAICRRMSKSTFFLKSSTNDDVNNGDRDNNFTNGNSNGNGVSTNEKKNKKSDKKKKKNLSKSKQVEQPHIVDYETAAEELNNYIATLRMLNIDVIELCPDEELKYDAVFAGDTAVSINGLCLICRPKRRLEETNEIVNIIRNELNLPIIEINDSTAELNAGDVLWTGKEIFVGLSNETNEAGARAVAAAFPEYPVTPVKVPNKDNLRLKSYVTMAGPDLLCVGRSQEATAILRRIEREASYDYKLISVDDDQAANVLYVNGTLLHRNDYPSSVALIDEKIDYPKIPIKLNELCLNHPNHGIDSMCILLRKSYKIQKIV